MTQEEIRKLFNEFLSSYDVEKHRKIWIEHQNSFREFWKTKIMNTGRTSIPEVDYDPIIRLIDIKARGFSKQTDEAVARVNLNQGVWYRIFNDLRTKENIRIVLDKIFKLDEESVLIEMIDRLEKENEENKNGLTGKNANALNALLFINNPDKFLSSVSLAHRFQVVSAFGFGDVDLYKTYGEKAIGTNRDILFGFRKELGAEAAPRTISSFIYHSSAIKSFWKKESDKEEEETGVEKVPSPGVSEFAIEKHLEDFLVANWESTELGKLYELIEEDGDIVSQQHPTETGPIDLLVKDRNSGEYVVIELKRGQTSDDTVGQLTRYMGWVKKYKSGGKEVKGIVIAGSYDKRLVYALSMVPNTEFFLYRISFALEKPVQI